MNYIIKVLILSNLLISDSLYNTMDSNTDKDLFQKAEEYDKYLLKLIEDGGLFDQIDSDEIIISKLQQLKISYDLQQRYDVEDCPMIIIRHGLSKFNLLSSIINYNLRDDVQQLSLNTQKYIKNTALHRGGEMQAEKKGEWLNTVGLELVLVSPLRRTIQTAFHLLKDHPQKGSLEIIVCPHIVEVLFTFGEMMTDYQAQKEEFTKLFSQNGMKINYDWADEMASKASIKDHLQLAISQNEEYKKRYHEEFKDLVLEQLSDDDYKNIYRRILHGNQMKGLLEDGSSLHRRFQHTKAELKTFFQKRGLFGQRLQKKVLLIAHLFSIRCLTGKNYLGHWKIDGSLDSSNCEAVPLNWKDLEVQSSL